MKNKVAFEMEVYVSINPNVFTIYVILKSYLMSYSSAVDGRSTELALVLYIIGYGINCAELSCYATRELVSYKGGLLQHLCVCMLLC
jgi:hypothetical protein